MKCSCWHASHSPTWVSLSRQPATSCYSTPRCRFSSVRHAEMSRTLCLPKIRHVFVNLNLSGIWKFVILHFVTLQHFHFKNTWIALDISILVYYIPYNNYYLRQRGYGFISRAGKCKIHFPLILACDALLPSHEFISSVDSVPTTGAVQRWMSDCDSACWKNRFDCVWDLCKR